MSGGGLFFLFCFRGVGPYICDKTKGGKILVSRFFPLYLLINLGNTEFIGLIRLSVIQTLS